MINKIKSIIAEFRQANNQNKAALEEVLRHLSDINKSNQEILWSQIYSDSIRGKSFLETLPLNIGRWAGNYTFFYLMNRILSDYKPKKILELGLGESTKFISVYLDSYLKHSSHVVVEHDTEWIDFFNSNFTLSERTTIIHCPLKQIVIENHISNSYDGFADKLNDDYDLIVIDGPFGCDHYSRYDVIHIVKKFNRNKSFILVFDDTQREGEKETVNKLLQILHAKDINPNIAVYSGDKNVTLIVSKDNKKYCTL